jgi:diguanylate cyclase (GGDEF)-like protein/PAS domain S-box-containing protein
MKRSKSAVAASSSTVAVQSNHDLERLLIDSLTEYAVFAISPEGLIVSWNSGAERMFGYTRDEIIGAPFTIIFTELDAQLGAPEMELTHARSGECTQHDRWHVRKDRTRFWGTNTVHPIYDATKTLAGYTKLIRDTTESHVAYLQLFDSEQRHRLLVESVEHFAIFALSLDGTIESWPAAAEVVFGYEAVEIVGSNVATLFANINGIADWKLSFLEEAAMCGSSNANVWFKRKDTSVFLGEVKVSELHSDTVGNSRGYVQIVHDITESNAAEHELRRRAECDELTNLPNRRAFEEFLVRAIALSKRAISSQFAVLFIDVDHLKQVNDTYGHVVADHILKETARRLTKGLRSADVAARFGGDEFAVLINGIRTTKDADVAAERILAAMRAPMAVEGHEIRASVSIGIAIGSATCEIPEQVIRQADAAMYAAKHAGRAHAVRFDANLAQNSFSGTIGAPNDLASAIANGEMRVAFQPIIRLKDNVLVGYEALIRWQHPTRGLLQPCDFLPEAESGAHIFALDRFMIKGALWQLREWQSEMLDHTLQMSVNISSREISHAGFIDELAALVTASGLGPNRLRIEITEGTSMERSREVRAMIAAIRALGVSIDIDDFGTGHSSLQALQHVKVDALKIDLSFVASIGSIDTILLDAVVALAHNLGTVAIAEGIETAEQLAYLTSVGCDFGQGFFFSPPLYGPAALQYATTL